MNREPGSEVAQYRLDRRLGSGGMGEVYLARDTRLDRLVAIKFLTVPADPQGRRRLMREARAVAALDHSGICAVYEVGTDPAGGDFIAMQYVEGDTLAARLRRGRLRPDEALGIGAHVAEALMAAHRRGIVHRDLKPHNIMLTPAGAPKILDFGLATYAPDTAAAANAATTSQVTDPDTVVGTPAYMAPEQIRNEPADFRSDVFALGAVLYECLTGQRAFTGATTAETLGKVLHVDPPAVSASAPEIGPAYDALCARMLHKIPDERFQSAEEVLGAIRALTPSTRFSASASITSPGRRQIRLSRVVFGVAVAAVVIAAFQFWPRGPTLAVAPPDAARWYDLGVDALRGGTYAAARTAFAAALNAFPDYPQAHWRQAEAHIALDDDRSANEALLQAARLVPDRSRLDAEDGLRFDAASAAALRHREDAIKAYQQLADRQPDDPGRWLDVGRAQEAGGRLPEASEAYAKAAAQDAQSAAARLRLGVLLTRAGKTDEGLASIDEAIDLHRKMAKTEGEAEALLRKGVALATLGKSDDARAMFDQVLQLATGSRYPAQRLGARLGLARLAYTAGRLTEAEDLAARAAADAREANLPTLAASGLIDLAGFLIGKGLHGQAEAKLAEGLRVAVDRGARRVEMRAKLTQASLRVQNDRPDEALSLATEPARYFQEGGEGRNATDAKLIMSRAHEALEHLEEASTLAFEAMTFAKAANDNVRLGFALENRAGQLTKAGSFPLALAVREEIDDLHRRMKDHASLPKDLTNHAELLILLGRGREAEDLLREVDTGIAAGTASYVERRERVALLRALRASTERRWADVARAVAAVAAAARRPAAGAAAPSSAQMFARILGEHALAGTGRSRQAPSDIAKWPLDAATPTDRREWTYWAAQTLLARGEAAMAGNMLAPILADKVAQANHELAWRLAAVSAEAARRGAAPGSAAAVAAQAKAGLEQVKAAWAGAANTYLTRPDLAALAKSVQ